MSNPRRELGLKLDGITRLRLSDKTTKVCWLFTYCAIVLASKNPKMVFLELTRSVTDLTRKIGWPERIGERPIIDLIINDDIFQIEIISTGEVIRGKRLLGRLDWNGHYYIEIYPEYYPFIKNIRRWCADQLREISGRVDHEPEGFSVVGGARKILGV